MPSQRPNIVLIMADDLGYSDLGCYGGEIRTPNLDKLAAEGLRFSQFYNNALCIPSRASLLTGLYPQQIGGDWSPKLTPGHNLTLAEVLREAGYTTLLAGKWHNGAKSPALPTDRGFDRFYGLLSGCCNYFNPGLPRCGEPAPAHKKDGDFRPWGIDGRVIRPFTPDSPDFYATDAFTDKAIEFLHQYGRGERPFFLYLPYTAPHFPLHARPEDIARYQGAYSDGWDRLRERRYRRLIEQGLIDETWPLSPRDEGVPAWADCAAQDGWSQKMAVYAAMVDRMDQGIGRVLAALDALGQSENTLVIFLSDNGGCSEHIDRTPERPVGRIDSYTTVDAPWANLSNTPFRRFKTFVHEGGIATPMIARWPRVIRNPGAITHQVGHVLDFMPTFVELSGARYPESHAGHSLPAMQGQSLLPLLAGQGVTERKPLFWELNGCRAVRREKWKLVTQGPPRAHIGVRIEGGKSAWELYDMEADRSERNDLADRHPATVQELAAQWDAWYATYAGGAAPAPA